jgi:hypothetical protein
MSDLHRRIRLQHKASQEFERNLAALHDDLGLRVPVRFLELRICLLEQLVEQTGGSLLTTGYRVQLSDAKKAVALRAQERRTQSSNLRMVRAQ